MRRIIKPDASFSPRKIFARMQGAWYEPLIGSMWRHDYATLVVPTPVNSQVGILQDLSLGTTYGPELYVGQPFLATNAGGSLGAYDTNTRELSNSQIGTFPYFPYFFIDMLTTGKFYRISAQLTGPVSNAFTSLTTSRGGVWPSLSSTVLNANNEFDAVLRADSSYFVLWTNGTTLWSGLKFASLSIREVLGNHAYQLTTANRPTYQLDANNLPLLRHDTNDTLVASLPNLNGGVFSNAGSVYFATPQGMSCLHNQSIGTTYNLPAPNTDIYGTVITPARLVPPLEKRLELYMLRLAGLIEPDYLLDDAGDILMTDDNEFLLRA